MKRCQYCGQELHEQASFCPYCMKSLIEKSSIVLKNKKSGKPAIWILTFATVILFIAIIAIVCMVFGRSDTTNESETDSGIEIITTSAVSTETTESTLTTTSKTTTTTTSVTSENTTTSTQTETSSVTETTEPITDMDVYYIGDYITEGKSSSQIKGYGGYEDTGGVILTIEQSDEESITFSIVCYEGSDYASDVISIRHITSQMINGIVEFEFNDMIDRGGTGVLTFENGKIHLQIWYADDEMMIDENLVFEPPLFWEP